MAVLTEQMKAITDEWLRTTKVDSLDRTEMRTRLIFEMFYDDEEGEPAQAIQDVITDMMHVAAERGVDMEAVIQAAAHMFTQEREEWELDGEEELGTERGAGAGRREVRPPAEQHGRERSDRPAP